jgi:hypothetical protein
LFRGKYEKGGMKKGEKMGRKEREKNLRGESYN